MQNSESLRQYFIEPLKRMPGISTFIQTTRWKKFRSRLTLTFGRRRNCHYTCFCRLPTQFEALSGPVLEFILKDRMPKPLKIVVLGCSNGAEAYSIASILRDRCPDLSFTICASDIDEECINKARTGIYTPEEVLNNKMMPADFINATFDKNNDCYVVKSDLRRHVHFDLADALDPNLKGRLGTADIVYAQHFLIHLDRKKARKVFRNICLLLNPRAALFISGIDLDILQRLTRTHKLTPCGYKVAEIYNEAASYSGGWPWFYGGYEPLLTFPKEWQRRYATIFLKA